MRTQPQPTEWQRLLWFTPHGTCWKSAVWNLLEICSTGCLGKLFWRHVLSEALCYCSPREVPGMLQLIGAARHSALQELNVEEVAHAGGAGTSGVS